MELTPGEKVVLAQIRKLCLDTRAYAHPLRAVTAEWLPVHQDAYRSAFSRLFARSLIQVSANKQAFRLTDAGLTVLGLIQQKPRGVPKRAMASGKPRAKGLKGLMGWLRKS